MPHTLAAVKTNELANTLRDVVDHSLLDKLGDVGAKTLVDSPEGTIAESKVETPCNTLDDVVGESLGDILGDVRFMVLVDTLADNLAEAEARHLVTHL